MSHTPERKERDCLNCGTFVQGKYCHKCGQANVIPKETFWAMVTHFVYDITHFDGKFFETVNILLKKPGFLSQQYMKGKRASYLNPIRMYIFMSAFFFLVFFSINKTTRYTGDMNEPLTTAQRDSILSEIKAGEYNRTDSAVLYRITALISDTTRPLRKLDLLPLSEDFVVMITFGQRYNSREQYDSIQAALPKSERDNWFQKLWNKRAIELNEKYRNDPFMSWREILDIVLHKLPYLLFVSLPFFALLLKVLYYRRKEFYFADHGIFTVHHYVVSFIMLLLVFLWNKLHGLTDWWFWNLLIIASVFAIPIYLYKAMRRFYGQSRWKTMLKFLLLNISAFILITLLFVAFFIFSVFNL